jgi:hypothetical protein
MQQEEAQETDSVLNQSSTNEPASAESCAAAASRLGGKSSCVVHGPSVGIKDGIEPRCRGRLKHEFGSMCMQQTGRDSFVHAIFRSYLSDWKVKYDSYSTCMRNEFRWNSY